MSLMIPGIIKEKQWIFVVFVVVVVHALYFCGCLTWFGHFNSDIRILLCPNLILKF